ncbi:U-scoloptoxin(01)-Cw1a [Frankliniella fusca]|uniref:U-scoloptoxin(01)-Cw1a n=1 Tax=Frankliniella fusca TaxID=407009 RepID=A0AAE1HF31_9NEOP|nr:U-scoloptoxin(01)-Cw1a [Frankliniella fusca]
MESSAHRECTARLGPRVNNPDIPATSFSCVGRHNGYYADVETDCQVYHMCLDRQQFSYACPNTTRFQQRMMVCDHWYQVDCPSAPLSYSANLLIGQRDRLFVEDDEHRALHEATVRTSKGLLKGLSQPAANALDRGAPLEKQPPASVAATRAPFAAKPPPPSSALELPFEDDEPQRGAFFQRSPSSSFAQVYQNLVQQPSSTTAAPPSSTPSSTTPSSTARSSAPSLSFTFSPPSTPVPPRFSISFSPSPSFPASGHNLQRPAPSGSAPSGPAPSGPAPSGPAPSGPARSVPSPSSPSPTFAPSTPSPSPAPATFFPSAPSPSPTAFSLNVPSAGGFSPSAPSSTFQPPSGPPPSTFFPSAPSPSTFLPSGPSANTFSPSGPSASTFRPSAPASNGFAFGGAQVRVPSRELEAPDFPEPDGNHLSSASASSLAPPPPTSFPSFPNTFAPGTAPSPVSFERMTAQQTSSFASPFPRSVSRPAAPPSPSRELTPPLLNSAFGSSASGASAPGLAASGPSAPGQSAPGQSAPEQTSPGTTGVGASGPGSFPRPFSSFNSTQRLSLFAATSAPSSAPRATPPPPSRELEAPVEESELDYNTVELKYQDTRRLFFIPTDDARDASGGKRGLEGDNSEPAPVVVIKYPSKSTRGVSGSTAHLKSYSEDVKRRVDPACPLCHPDFVVPGTCSPCVLLR